MKIIKLLIIFITLASLSGCGISTRTFIKKLKDNPNLTPVESKKMFGKPSKEEELFRGEIRCKLYGSYPEFAICFRNDKLYRYGEFDSLFLLDMARDLGAITQEEYRQYGLEMLRQQQLNTAMTMQMFNQYNQMQYQQQMLNNQRRMINLMEQNNNQQRYRDSGSKIVGQQYNTDCQVDNFGNIHYRTQ